MPRSAFSFFKVVTTTSPEVIFLDYFRSFALTYFPLSITTVHSESESPGWRDVENYAGHLMALAILAIVTKKYIG